MKHLLFFCVFLSVLLSISCDRNTDDLSFPLSKKENMDELTGDKVPLDISNPVEASYDDGSGVLVLTRCKERNNGGIMDGDGYSIYKHIGYDANGKFYKYYERRYNGLGDPRPSIFWGAELLDITKCP